MCQTPVAAGGLAGRWDLTITTPATTLPSWIEVSREESGFHIRMVGVTMHATPLKEVGADGDRLWFVSPKGEEGFASDMRFEGRLTGGELRGTVTGPAGASWRWTGRRAPELARQAGPSAGLQPGAPIKLFNGVDFTGWSLLDPRKAGSWKVEDGQLIALGHGSELVTNSKWEDFQLHIECKNGPSSNSGVFLRGRYELQMETDSAAEPASHHTGGIYGFLAPAPEQPRLPGVWQTFDVTLAGRRVTVVQNGVRVIDNREIPGITGGALDSDEALPGPIYLQGSEDGPVAFRNIVIRPLQQ